jgi:lipoprotein-releasing system ATP-binding protein
MSNLSSTTETPASAGLQTVGVRKSYPFGRGQVRVLREIDIVFPAGEITMIQGASGSGKSTLLHILGGLEQPDEGRVLWNGESIYDWPGNQLAAWRNHSIGFVFQAYHLLPELSALENVDLPARLDGRGDNAVSERLLDQVGLAHRAHHRPAELSGGEQQRVAIARALRNNPQLILADEPTGNLDSPTGKEIMALLLELQSSQKKTLIVVTHDDTIARLGQHLFRLATGEIQR